MRVLTAMTTFLLLLMGTAIAEPCLSVNTIENEEAYVEWLQDKTEVWTSELSDLKLFAPDQVKSMENTLEAIRSKSDKLERSQSPEETAQLKEETHNLVFSIERKLEQTFADLERASQPALVMDF